MMEEQGGRKAEMFHTSKLRYASFAGQTACMLQGDRRHPLSCLDYRHQLPHSVRV